MSSTRWSAPTRCSLRRVTKPPPLAHVVLHEPEIPNNTGNIGRTCVALGAALHLIHPLGFDVGEKACRRAGLDYWPRLEKHEHASKRAYDDWRGGARPWVFTARGGTPVFDADLAVGDHLLFGGETRGLPDEVLEAHGDRLVCLPMRRGERSLNLATAVCAALYELLRRGVKAGDVRLDGSRLDF